MARCQQIYAGSSIYAAIASLMGDVPLRRTTALFDASRAAELILDELKHRQLDRLLNHIHGSPNVDEIVRRGSARIRNRAAADLDYFYSV